MTCTSCPSTSQKNSSHDMSNANDTVCATRIRRPPASFTAGSKIRSRWLSSMLTRPEPGTTTPLGRPVEPEV